MYGYIEWQKTFFFNCGLLRDLGSFPFRVSQAKKRNWNESRRGERQNAASVLRIPKMGRTVLWCRAAPPPLLPQPAHTRQPPSSSLITSILPASVKAQLSMPPYTGICAFRPNKGAEVLVIPAHRGRVPPLQSTVFSPRLMRMRGAGNECYDEKRWSEAVNNI